MKGGSRIGPNKGLDNVSASTKGISKVATEMTADTIDITFSGNSKFINGRCTKREVHCVTICPQRFPKYKRISVTLVRLFF